MPVSHNAGEFTCRVVPDRECVRIVPVGEMDLAAMPLVEREARALIAAGFTRVVVDLRETTYIDSTGLHLLLRLQDDSDTDGFQLQVINGTEQVKRLFEITNMTSRLPFVSPGDLG